MTTEFNNIIIHADVLDSLAKLPDGCVHTCITSPPYYGLRDYGTAQWQGGDVGCDHKDELFRTKKDVNKNTKTGSDKKNRKDHQFYKDVCKKCGALRIDAQIGLEQTPEAYIEKMVEVFRQVHRVLHPSGTIWLNMGDSYWGSGGSTGHTPETKNLGRKTFEYGAYPSAVHTQQEHSTLKPKDLFEMPSEIAMALRKSGWYLRSRMPWIKRNSMPESTTDRPSSAIEYIFLLSKSPAYFYDNEAVRVKYKSSSLERSDDTEVTTSNDDRLVNFKRSINHNGRNFRNTDPFFNTWQGLYQENGTPLAFVVNPQGYAEAHFATFPQKLVEPCIKAGTSQKGCCPDCGEPWDRVTEQRKTGQTHKMADGWETKLGTHGIIHRDGKSKGESGIPVMMNCTVGWKPQCKCYGVEIIHNHPKAPAPKKEDETDQEYNQCLLVYEKDLQRWNNLWKNLNPIYEGLKTEPCVVLDPFMGSGTTALVARKLDRNYIGIELNKKYIQMAEKRLEKELGMFI